MKFLVILLFTVVISVCHGFVLDIVRGFTTCNNAKELKTPVGGVEQSCLDDADIGNCRFYQCFERRYPCDTCGFAQDYGQHVCEKFSLPTYFNRFTDAGKRWLNATNRCLMATMKEMYQRPTVSCDMTKSTMIDQVSNCYLRNDANISFCDIAVDNRDALIGVFEAGDFIKSHRVLTEVIQLITNCGGSRTNAVGERVRAFFREQLKGVDGAGGRVKDLIANATAGGIGGRIRDFVSQTGITADNLGSIIRNILSESDRGIGAGIADQVPQQNPLMNPKASGNQGANNTEIGSRIKNLVSQSRNRIEERVNQLFPANNQTSTDNSQNDIMTIGSRFLQFVRNIFG